VTTLQPKSSTLQMQVGKLIDESIFRFRSGQRQQRDNDGSSVKTTGFQRKTICVVCVNRPTQSRDPPGASRSNIVDIVTETCELLASN